MRAAHAAAGEIRNGSGPVGTVIQDAARLPIHFGFVGLLPG